LEADKRIILNLQETKMKSARKLEIELRSASQGCVFTAVDLLPQHCRCTVCWWWDPLSTVPVGETSVYRHICSKAIVQLFSS